MSADLGKEEEKRENHIGQCGGSVRVHPLYQLNTKASRTCPRQSAITIGIQGRIGHTGVSPGFSESVNESKEF